MNFADPRPRGALWIFIVLCAITAVILITSFGAPPPEKPLTVEQPATGGSYGR
jgi:hypothetical protein